MRAWHHRIATRALAAGLLLAGCANHAPEIPDPDRRGMEEMVASVLGEARRGVLDDPRSAEAWGRFGAACHAHALLEEAVACYDQARRRAAEEFVWAYLLAVAGEERADPVERVLALFDEAGRIRADYAPLHLRRGRLLLASGQPAAAAAAFERATALAPDFPQALLGLGQAYVALGEPARALESLGRAARLAPADGAVHAALAGAYAGLGLEEAAAQAAARGRRREPARRFQDPIFERHVVAMGASTRHWFARGRMGVEAGRFAEASRDLEVVRRLRPDDADALYLLGRAREGVGDRAAAREELSRALAVDPGHVPARLHLARMLMDEGRPAEALAELRRARQAAPDDAETLGELARVQATLGDTEAAIEAYERLVALVPDDARVRVNLGTLYGRRGVLGRAAEQLEAALGIEPDYANAHHRLGVVLDALGQADLAQEHYLAAVRLEPEHPARQALRREAGDAAESPRAEFRRIAERLYGGKNRYLGRGARDELRRRLADGSASPRARVELEEQLTRRLLEAGEVGTAVETIERAAAGAAALGDAQLALAVERTRALAALREAEVQNCLLRHNADCCIFPLAGGGVHVERAPAERALASFARLLEADADDLVALWLYNLTAMALGRWPQEVPARWRIPPEAFASAEKIARFRDVAPGLGVDTLDLCGGAAVDDFDGDGRLDIVTSTFDPRGPMHFHRADGRGGFEERSTAAGLADQLGGLNLIGGDYDGDGDVDLFVLRGAWLQDEGRIRNSLLQNDGHGRFADVTRRAGLATPAYPTQTAAWGDFDNDGDLDLYVGNESRMYLPADRADYPSQLFRNDGDGSFTDVAREAGVTNDRYTKGVAAGDYDNDGDLDLYVSNVLENRLYRNNGGLRFTDVAREAGVTEPAGRSFATWFFDYDNDGWLDLFVAAYQATVADLAAEALGLPHAGVPPRLYRNRRDGTFQDVAVEVGLDRPFLPMGANFGDIDGDGWLDVYLATGDPSFESLMPNVMLRNDGGRRFLDVTQAGGFGHLQKGHGVAFADLDQDGDQDLYHQLGGFFPGDAFRNVLFENPGHGRPWLALRLVGSRSNRAGLGARVAVTVDTPRGPRTIHRAAGSVSSFGGSPTSRLEIGLGDATAIRRLEVWWPASGTRQTFERVEPAALVTIREDRPDYAREPLLPTPFRKGGV